MINMLNTKRVKYDDRYNTNDLHAVRNNSNNNINQNRLCSLKSPMNQSDFTQIRFDERTPFRWGYDIRTKR